MPTTTLRSLAIASVVPAIALLAGCGSGAGAKAGAAAAPARHTSLRVTTYDANDHVAFVVAVRRLGGPTMDVKVIDGATATPDAAGADIVGAVAAGSTEVAVVPIGVLDAAGVASLDALHAPLGITTYDQEARALASPAVAAALAALDAVGVVGIGLVPGAMMRPLGVGGPFLAPPDVVGHSVRSESSTVRNEFLEAIGAARVAEHPRGGAAADRAVLSAIDASRAGLAQPRNQLAANVVLWPDPSVIIANRAWFAALDAADRSLLRKAAAAAVAPAIDALRAEEASYVRTACTAGLAISDAPPAAMAAWEAEAAPVRARLATASVEGPVARAILPSAAQHPADGLPTCSVGAPAVAPAIVVPAGLRGSFRVHVGVDEQVAAGSTPHDAVASAGRLTLTFAANGRLTIHQDPLDAKQALNCDLCALDLAGSYDVREGCLHLHVASPFTADYGCYAWRLFHGRLVLSGPRPSTPPLPDYDAAVFGSWFNEKPMSPVR